MKSLINKKPPKIKTCQMKNRSRFFKNYWLYRDLYELMGYLKLVVEKLDSILSEEGAYTDNKRRKNFNKNKIGKFRLE